VAHVSQRAARLFGEDVMLPDGPFMLAFVAQAPIFPVFIARTSFHRYKIIARAPIHCRRDERSRESVIEEAMRDWCRILENVIAANWSEWFSLVPIFPER
jgi:lauroyl/myristoyl acyltransferase